MPFACAWSKVLEEACVYIYAAMGLFEEAVDLSLKVGGAWGVVCNVRGAVKSGVKITAKVWVWFRINNK